MSGMGNLRKDMLGSRDWRSMVEGTDYVTWFIANSGLYGEPDSTTPGAWGLRDVKDMWFNRKGELLVSDIGPYSLKKFDLDKCVTTKTVTTTPSGAFNSQIGMWYNQVAGGVVCGYLIGANPYLAKFDDDLNLVWEIATPGETFKGVGESGQYIVMHLGAWQFRVRRTSDGAVVTALIDYNATPLSVRADPLHYAFTDSAASVKVMSGSHGLFDGATLLYTTSWFLPNSWVSHHGWKESAVNCFAGSGVPSFTAIFNSVNLDIETWFAVQTNQIAFDPFTRGNIILGTWKKGLWAADRRTYKPHLLPWRYCYDGSIGSGGHQQQNRIINPCILGYKKLKLYLRGNGSYEVRLLVPIRPYSGVGVFAGEYLAGAVGVTAGYDIPYRDSMDTVYHSFELDLSYITHPVFQLDIWNFGSGVRETEFQLEAEV